MTRQFGFATTEDAREAAWLGESLERMWGREKTANYVAAVVPRGFAAYARVFHPARARGEQRETSWAEVARHYGRRPHAQMQWHAITGLNPADPYASTANFEAPAMGSLPAKQAEALVEVLRKHTKTPRECYFAVWEGWGFLDAGGPWAGTARFRLPDRGYYLLRGPIEGAATSLSPHCQQSASLWWPKDRAWCVATEVDLMWTYVGGSAACIEEILADGRLEAWRATLDDRADIDGDHLNR